MLVYEHTTQAGSDALGMTCCRRMIYSHLSLSYSV